jgi:hypothetical protein
MAGSFHFLFLESEEEHVICDGQGAVATLTLKSMPCTRGAPPLEAQRPLSCLTTQEYLVLGVRYHVVGNIDSITICILRRAICILQKFLCNMDTSSKPFLFRRNESILHLHPY